MAVFAEKYGSKYARAVECLTKDRETLLAFYDLPAEHWDLLRTTNPTESVFATVRHRTVRTKGALSPTMARLTVFKLVMGAAKSWRRLKGETQLPKVVAGVTFRDGTEVILHAQITAPPDHLRHPNSRIAQYAHTEQLAGRRRLGRDSRIRMRPGEVRIYIYEVQLDFVARIVAAPCDMRATCSLGKVNAPEGRLVMKQAAGTL